MDTDHTLLFKNNDGTFSTYEPKRTTPLLEVERDPTPLYHAAKELINMQLDTGDFPQQDRVLESISEMKEFIKPDHRKALLDILDPQMEHVGCFNSSLYFNYGNYRNLYPIWALGEFHRWLLAKK
ncbi:hypothetical protein PR202_gb16983 [Eleusine coracana subsp. coracana]|uniref:Uncharacterized protein n=1 Tax=Eleusine coracana subsp. coracana TaxID=191504 RepID=A0AAV5EZF9_ELECO|nr:hypothetical protein PR202_gb16983 [Eleusine coracana subsp. coracana]